MKGGVLAIPLDEIRKQFEKNSRQDVKIVASDQMSEIEGYEQRSC